MFLKAMVVELSSNSARHRKVRLAMRCINAEEVICVVSCINAEEAICIMSCIDAEGDLCHVLYQCSGRNNNNCLYIRSCLDKEKLICFYVLFSASWVQGW